jgi:hypothetical protein
MIHAGKFCSGYTQTINDKSIKSPEACYNWVKAVDPTAKYFFYRYGHNNHCSPCPSSYQGGTGGLTTNGTRSSFDVINVYEIVSAPEVQY